MRSVKSRYLLFQKAEAALIEEKAEKLFGITRLLDSYLEGDYEDILQRRLRSDPSGPPSPYALTREKKIAVLNEALAPFTDRVAASFPGVGVGYYSRDLRAILTYGPSSEFGSKVGLDLGPDHLGWQAMETGKETVAVGSMVRGEIMNCMRPLIRKGRAIGFVWANETLEDIYAQIQLGAKKLFFSPEIEPLLGLTGLLLFSSRVLVSGKWSGGGHAQLVRDVERLERYLKLFLNSLSLAVILSDSDDRITFVSSGIKDILGEEVPELTGMNVREALAGIGIDPHVALDDSLNGARNQFINVPIKTRDGEKLITMVSTVVKGPEDARKSGEGDQVETARGEMVETGGGEHGRVIILEDLKEARAQEERLERAERLAAVGELAAAIAHEIRNPLTVLKGGIGLVPEKLDNPEFLKKFSEVATGEMDRINRTVESLLQFSRYSQPNMSAIDLERVISTACDVISAYAKVNKVELEFRCPEVVPPIWGDEDHLIHAFLNLFLNGIQAMPSGGKLLIELAWKSGARYIHIFVKDSGVGIPLEHRDRIFDMFFTTKTGGTGLGLPLVQRIIYEHQGFIEFESEVGVGTTFIIKIPVASES